MGVISAIALVLGLIVGWLIRHYFKTPGFKSDTTRFFRQSTSNVKLYSPPVLRATILISLAAVGFTQMKVAEWQVRENLEKDKINNLVEAGKMTRDEARLEKAIIDAGSLITMRDYQLMKLGIVFAAFTVWVSFIDSSWTKAKERKESENTKSPLG